jgi:hypothetical protein
MPAFRGQPHTIDTLRLSGHGVPVTPATSLGSFARRWPVLSALSRQRKACSTLNPGRSVQGLRNGPCFGLCQSSVKQGVNVSRNLKIFKYSFLDFLAI